MAIERGGRGGRQCGLNTTGITYLVILPVGYNRDMTTVHRIYQERAYLSRGKHRRLVEQAGYQRWCWTRMLTTFLQQNPGDVSRRRRE